MNAFAPLQYKSASTTTSVRQRASVLQSSHGVESPKASLISEPGASSDRQRVPGFSLSRIPIDPPVQTPRNTFEGHRGNNTGLPDKLKAGIERLSGISLDDVHVHYNSSQVARLQALAYTQGSDIHLGPGQEKHLAHEAWHVAQQKQEQVQPTLQVEGVMINDDQELENEADAMGARAIAGTTSVMGEEFAKSTGQASSNTLKPVQRVRVQNKRKAKTKTKIKKKDKSYKAQERLKKAQERLKRAHQRGNARTTNKGELLVGRFQTPTGPITISGGPGGGQRMTQSRKGDYEKESFGSYPAYADVQAETPEEALSALIDPEAELPDDITTEQKLALSLGVGLTHISEPFRAPGYDKYTRAIIRQRIEEGSTAPHPYDPSVNVAVSSADEARNLMSGATPLTEDQVSLINEYLSESSDEEEEDYAFRTGLLQQIGKD